VLPGCKIDDSVDRFGRVRVRGKPADDQVAGCSGFEREVMRLPVRIDSSTNTSGSSATSVPGCSKHVVIAAADFALTDEPRSLRVREVDFAFDGDDVRGRVPARRQNARLGPC